MTPIRKLFAELRSRSVWRVLGIYGAASWAALEVASTLTESFGLPEWFPAFALGLLVIGLPIVLATSLVQEPASASGPDSPDPAAGANEQPSTGGAPVPPSRAGAAPGATSPAGGGSARGVRSLLTWRNAVIGGLGAFALWGVLATGWILFGTPSSDAASGDPALASVAVLPLQNLSPDPDDAFFADGVHEEVITSLASIDALKVISRTSVLEYRETQKNLREIAEELGVETILEGSVRRAGDRVRITVQLIDASDDSHLWAETFERDLRDIFAIQSEVAERIAEALHAELDPAERALLSERPTTSTEAYEYYLRGVDYLARGYRPEGLEAARRMFERAVELDPEYREAYARLAFADLITYWLGYDRVPERLERARAVHATLRGLDADDAATHYVGAYLLYYGEHDYPSAARELRLAEDGFPHEAQLSRAYVLRRMGEWEEHIRLMGEAQELSPRDATIPYNLGETMLFQRRYDESIRQYRRALSLAPDWGRAYSQLAQAYVVSGDVPAARAALADAPAVNEDLLVLQGFQIAMIDRDAEAALRLVNDAGNDWFVAQFTNAPAALLRGWAHELGGELDAAEAAYRRAASLVRDELAERPEDNRLWHALAFAQAGLGERDAALAASDRALELYPVEKDHAGGRDALLLRARLYARVGAVDRAVGLVQRLLEEPSPLSTHLLRLEPEWEEVRRDPRIQALLTAAAEERAAS